MKPKAVKQILSSVIRDVAADRSFLVRPDSDFTRSRKLSLLQMLRLILSMGGSTISRELLGFFRTSPHVASSSAFVQSRAKISHTAFEAIFQQFTAKTDTKCLYRGYRLLAADGSGVHFPTDPSDPDSFFPGSNGQKPYNLIHLNALYDLLTHTYRDVVLQKGSGSEKDAVIEMLQRSRYRNVLLIADRNYESYNLMAYCQEKGWRFLIRVKDHAVKGIVTCLPLPDIDSFDVPITVCLTNHTSKAAKQIPHYKFLPSTAPFDFFPRDAPIPFYELHFRVIRFSIAEGAYETVITNLPEKLFPMEEVKKLYAMRWGIETSFRDLKHTVGLLRFHSKKAESIIQEIFAALTMYNFARVITQSAVLKQNKRKLSYQVNFAQAVHLCRQFFRDNAISPPALEALLTRYVTPIRPNRHAPRSPGVKPVVIFQYR